MLGQNCLPFRQGDKKNLKNQLKPSILVHAKTKDFKDSGKICFQLYFYTQLTVHGCNVEQPKEN